MELLKVENLTFTYPECRQPALRQISFTVEGGEFIVLCGATGSGKSTLLRMLKRELAMQGEREGRVFFDGKELSGIDDKTSASQIGFVMQKPEQQIVTDKVWHELAFGLENLGFSRDVIARRTAEMSSYFGIGQWYEREVSTLSGGQKQLLNLASVLVMQPKLLILDEPTAQLDPIAASDFISTLKKINQDFGITIIMVEHRLEEAVPISDRLLIMEHGMLIADGAPKKVISSIRDRDEILCGMPAAARLYTKLDKGENCPLTVREGRNYIQSGFSNKIITLPAREETFAKEENARSDQKALEFREVYFRYSRNSADILKGLNLSVSQGELFCILGENGSGKTTALKAASDLIKPYSGTIKIFGKKIKDYKNQSLYRECLALLPQDVQTVFLRNTVRKELEECCADLSTFPYDFSELLDQHPYDLSGGEQQLVAMAKVLAAKPRLLLLDEPTKGLDANAKRTIIKILKTLTDSGITIVSVTHDIEFAAACADCCAMFFGGRIVSMGRPESFFSENSFYTTAISRMTRGYYKNTVTVDAAIKLCKLNKH